jgi:DNA repair exonuclease SbcCD nuclease subunit
MSVRFIHTADWQIGKPFAWVSDPDKRGILQRKRLDAVKRIAQAVQQHKASFVVVAGDLFDSPTPTKSLVSEVCSLIGNMGVPVFVIPGNHDHGGPLGLWEKPFFSQERTKLAANLTVLLEYKPYELDNSIILPCPLLKRHEISDPTAWLRDHAEGLKGLPHDKPRIVIAHGSVQDFGRLPDEDEGDQSTASNRIELDKIQLDQFDFIALGDWHGTKSVNNKAWYSGTPELDRFNKGGEYAPGNVLVVEAARGMQPSVTPVPISETRWHEEDFSLNNEDDLRIMESRIETLVGREVNLDLMKLRVTGLAGLEGFSRLEDLYETLRSRFISLRLEDSVLLQPSEEELLDLTTQSDDPLTAQIAGTLVGIINGTSEDAEVARVALRELYIVYNANK